MNAIQTIKATYDYDQCKEIVDHGCQSGVCSEHIYYGDTIKFFDTYEDEIIDCVSDVLGDEELGEIFKASNYSINMYKNNMTWTFIELIASLVVDDVEEQELNDDKVVGNYMKEEISNYGYTKSDLEYVMFG